MSNFLNKENNMYIRRKVFSQAQDWDYGYEEMAEERLYSTGDVELDELLERAFCEGYEAAQREFGAKEWTKKQYDKAADYAKKQYDKAADFTKKHLGEGGTVAKKVSGWAKSGEKKIQENISKKEANELKKLVKGLGKGEIKGFFKGLKKLDHKGNKAQQLAMAGLKKVEQNPRAAAAIGLGTIATGAGAGIYASTRKKED